MENKSLQLFMLKDELIDCERCDLHKERKQPVIGRGNPDAPIVFVGEAPGATEDELGIPFCGKSGKLLDNMIIAMGKDPEKDVYVLNINKCRPPNNRKPFPEEIESCKPYLDFQLDLIKPKVMVALGATAIVGLCGPGLGITKRRGQWEEYKGVSVMPTFHPAYCLRNPASKKEVWTDLQSVMKRLEDDGIK